MHCMTSGKSAAMSLLLIVMLATIFFRAIFFRVKFLSFLSLWSSARSSATLPYCKRNPIVNIAGAGLRRPRGGVLVSPGRGMDGEKVALPSQRSGHLLLQKTWLGRGERELVRRLEKLGREMER